MNTVDMSAIEIADHRCYTVSSHRKCIKVRDVLSLLRLAIKLAAKEDGNQIQPITVVLFADSVVRNKSTSFHVVISRDATPAEDRHIKNQLNRSCIVLGDAKKNRLVSGIHNASSYLFHERHNYVFAKQLFS